MLVTASTSSDEPIHQAAQMCRKRARIVLVGVTGLNISREDFYKKELTFQVSASYVPVAMILIMKTKDMTILSDLLGGQNNVILKQYWI